MIYCHFSSPFSLILAGKHSFSLMPPPCLPTTYPHANCGKRSPHKPCLCFTHQQTSTQTHTMDPSMNKYRETHRLAVCRGTPIRSMSLLYCHEGKESSLGTGLPPWLSPLPPSWLSHFEDYCKWNDSAPVFATPLWGSLATLAAAHQPQQAHCCSTWECCRQAGQLKHWNKKVQHN